MGYFNKCVIIMPAREKYWKTFSFYWESIGISLLWDCGNLVYDVATPLIVWPLLSTFYNRPSAITQCAIICLVLPLVFFLSIFPSITVLSSKAPLSMCPIHFLDLFLLYISSTYILYLTK